MAVSWNSTNQFNPHREQSYIDDFTFIEIGLTTANNNQWVFSEEESYMHEGIFQPINLSKDIAEELT